MRKAVFLLGFFVTTGFVVILLIEIFPMMRVGNSPITGFLSNTETQAYKKVDVPAELIPIKIKKETLENLMNSQGFKEDIDLSNENIGETVYRKKIWSYSCEYEFHVFTKFNSLNELERVQGFSPSYHCNNY